MRDLMHDRDLRASLAASGLARIRSRHSCGHRAVQRLSIFAEVASTCAGAA